MKPSCRCFMLLLLVTGPVLAEQNAFFGWYGISARGRFDKLSPSLRNFEWSLLNQARLSHTPQPQFGGTSNRLTENLLFIQLNYYISEQLHIGLGYTRDWLDRFNENRAYEEIGWRAPRAEWGTLTLRTRLEQRVNDKLDRNNVGVRLRELVQWSHPFPGIPQVKLIVNNEVMWYLNSSSWRSDGLTENRAFAGISVPLVARTQLILGYMNQFVRQGSSKEHLLNHILFVNLDFQF